jgi:hypothetical protein
MPKFSSALLPSATSIVRLSSYSYVTSRSRHVEHPNRAELTWNRIYEWSEAWRATYSIFCPSRSISGPGGRRAGPGRAPRRPQGIRWQGGGARQWKQRVLPQKWSLWSLDCLGVCHGLIYLENQSDYASITKSIWSGLVGLVKTGQFKFEKLNF